MPDFNTFNSVPWASQLQAAIRQQALKLRVQKKAEIDHHEKLHIAFGGRMVIPQIHYDSFQTVAGVQIPTGAHVKTRPLTIDFSNLERSLEDARLLKAGAGAPGGDMSDQDGKVLKDAQVAEAKIQQMITKRNALGIPQGVPLPKGILGAGFSITA